MRNQLKHTLKKSNMSDPSNSVLFERINGIDRLINQRFDSQDQRITSLHDKANATNGRVKSLEKYQWGIMGAVAIITTLVLPVLFMIAAKYINF